MRAIPRVIPQPDGVWTSRKVTAITLVKAFFGSVLAQAKPEEMHFIAVAPIHGHCQHHNAGLAGVF